MFKYKKLYKASIEKCKILENNIFNLKRTLYRKETEHIEEIASKNNDIIKLQKQIENYQKINNFKTYKLFIRQYNILANDYVTYERTIKTKDIYHEIGKIYSTELCAIKRIDYYEIEGE